MESIGSNIKRERLRKGWTQNELATAAAMTKASISHYEKGQRQPRAAQLQDIANALDISVFDLTSFSPEKKEELKKASQGLLRITDVLAHPEGKSEAEIATLIQAKAAIEADLSKWLTVAIMTDKAQADAKVIEDLAISQTSQPKTQSESKAEKRKRQQLDQLILAFSALTEENRKKVLERVSELEALQSIQKRH